MTPPPEPDRERQEEPHRGFQAFGGAAVTRADAARAVREEAAARRRRAGPLTPAIRKAVVGRRRKCPECGSIGPLEVDHLRPVRLGGKTTLDNLRPICARCNRSRGDTTGGEARTCGGCGRAYRRARGGEDGRCDRCRRESRARARSEVEAARRKAASERKRVRALRARRHLRAVRNA